MILPSFAFAQCATDAWTSCNSSTNPNPARGASHWIQYDFNQPYGLASTHIWNYNRFDETQNGFRQIVVDYSLDGVNWTEWGVFDLAEASGIPSYTGETGPDLTGITAQHILITAISNYGGSCYGLAELKFDVDQTVSTIELDESGDMRFVISPNPVRDLAQLQFSSSSTEDFSVTVFDRLGRALFTELAGYAGENSLLSLDVASLPAGIYHLRVAQEGKFISGSFVKQ